MRSGSTSLGGSRSNRGNGVSLSRGLGGPMGPRFSRVLADHHHPKKATHPRSHAPRGNAVFDARRRDLRPRPGTRSVPDGIPTRSVGTRGKPPPDPCCGKADVKLAVVLSEDSPYFSRFFLLA